MNPPDENIAAAEFRGTVTAWMKEIRDDIKEIKSQTTRTNGRVNALETSASVKAGQEAQRDRTNRIIFTLVGLLATFFGGIGAVLVAHFIK